MVLEEFSNLEIVHNETDFDRYSAFQERMDSIYSVVNEKLRVERIEGDLKKWLEGEGKRWRKYTLDNLVGIGGEKAKKLVLKSSFAGMFISGAPSSGKTTLSRAVVRELIALGKFRPSEVKTVSESELLNLGRRGFQGESEFKKLLSSKNQLYILDDFGEKGFYNLEREIPYLDAFITHAYDEGKALILVSSNSLEKATAFLGSSAKGKIREICPVVETSKVVKDSPVKGSRKPSAKTSTKKSAEPKIGTGRLSGTILEAFGG